MHGAGFQGRSEIGQLLIDHGIDPFEKHGDGYVPIQRACWGNEDRHTDTVKMFLSNNVFNEDIYNSCKDSPSQSTRKVIEEYNEKHRSLPSHAHPTQHFQILKAVLTVEKP